LAHFLADSVLGYSGVQIGIPVTCALSAP